MYQDGTLVVDAERPQWRNPAILIIMGTSFVASLSLFMIIPFLTLHLTSVGLLSLKQAGLLLGISFWIKRGGAFFGGIAADRFGRRFMMILALSVRIPGYLMFAYGQTFYSLLVASVLVSAGGALYMPAAKSALTLLTPAGERVRTFAMRMGVINAGAALGPLMGAALLGESAKTIFLVAAASFLVITIVNVLIRFPDSHNASGSSVGLAISVAKSPRLLRMMLFGALFFLMYIQTETIFPVMVRDAGHADKIGLLFGCWAAVVVVAQFALSRIVLWAPRSLCVLFGFSGFFFGFLLLHAVSRAAGSFIFDFVPLPVGFFAAISLFSVSEAILNLRLDYETSLVPADRVGTSFGFVNIACGLGGLLGSALGTSTYEALGSSRGMLDSVWMIMALLAALSALVLRRQRDEGLGSDASGQA